MKYLLICLTVILGCYSCDSGRSAIKSDVNSSNVAANDTLRIANDELEYEILIIEPGFNQWVLSQPPMGYYGLTFLENRNAFYALEYNRRVQSIDRSRDLYPQEINYDPGTHYGLEVNYLLYNYFKYFEQTYNQKLR